MTEKKRMYKTEKPALETPKEPIYNKIVLRNLMGVRLKLIGSSTGKTYFWSVGAELEVDHEDALAFLEKKLGRTCCGNPENRIFEIVYN